MSTSRQVKVARISAAAVASLALVFTAGCSRNPNVRKQKYLESGKKYEAAGKYKEASIQFSNALKVDRNFADAYYELAKVDLKMNSPIPAYSALMKTVDLAPSNLAARITLGDLLLAGHATDRAAAQANAVLAANPNDADAYALLGGVAQSKGDHAEAFKNIQRALALEPNRPEFHSALALLDAGDPAKESDAEQEMLKASSLDPKNPTPRSLLARLLEKKGDTQGAEQQLQAAIAAAPTNIQAARVTWPGSTSARGDKAKAEQTSGESRRSRTIPTKPPHPPCWRIFIARPTSWTMRWPSLRTSTRSTPKSFPHPARLCSSALRQEGLCQIDRSGKPAHQERDPGNTDVQTLNALLLLNTGKTDDAFTLLKKAVKENPNSVETQLLLARVAASKGDLETSETSLRAASKQDPANLEAASGLATIAIERNDASMLSEVAEKTLQMHPDFANAYLWRGTAEVSRKEFDKSRGRLSDRAQDRP